jgi:aspartate carbamoyltransferase regulatory subunit
MEKKLKVAALCNGTVIDHIPSDKLFKVVSMLQLDKCTNQITIGNNLESSKIGSKGIIKISDRFFEENEINKIALLVPNAVINVIKEYEVVSKQSLLIPDTILEIVQCANPNCITNNQQVSTRFKVVKVNEKLMLRCHYCEKDTRQDKVKLK